MQTLKYYNQDSNVLKNFRTESRTKVFGISPTLFNPLFVLFPGTDLALIQSFVLFPAQI
jgi:hypothetical protein